MIHSPAHGLPRGRRRHLRGRRRQGAHQDPRPRHLQPRRAVGDRLLRRAVPSRPRRAIASRCWWRPRTAWAPRSRSPSPRASTTPWATTSWPIASTTSWSRGPCPLFFLDYIALGRMDPLRVEQIVSGLRARLHRVRLPAHRRRDRRDAGHLRADDYDLAGFIVGVVEKDKALPRGVREGDVLLGPALRWACTRTATPSPARSCSTAWATRGRTPRARARRARSARRSSLPIGAISPPSSRSSSADKIRALAHITGGGFPGNIPRVLPQGLGAQVRRGSWEVPPLFRLIQTGRRRRRRRDVPHLQHGRGHDRGRRARGSPRGRALPRAARRDELRDRLGGRGRRGRLRVAPSRRGAMAPRVGRSMQDDRRPRSAAGARNLQALLDAGRGSTASSGGRIAVVISNVEDARRPRARARGAGMPALFRDHRGRAREAFDAEVAAPARGARRRARLSRGLHAPALPRVPPRVPGPDPERAPVAAAGLSRASRPSAGLRARGEGERRHRAPRGRGPRHGADRAAGGRARAARTTARRAWPRGSSRPSTASTRGPCAILLEGRYRLDGPARRRGAAA